MKKKFKIEEEKFKDGDIPNYGKKMSVLALQALVGVACIGTSAAIMSSNPGFGETGLYSGIGFTIISLGRMFHTFKYHKDYNEYIERRKEK